MKKILPAVLAVGLVAGGVGALMLPGESAQTADHLDPPSRTNPNDTATPDRAADIADIYAWAADDNLNIIMTFAGPAPADQPATYDRDVLYRLVLSTDGDATSSEHIIDVRFGQDGANEYGVQARNIPMVGILEGPVETNLTRNGAVMRAGLFDDPFFFDLQGFRETVDTGTIQFDSNRDFFAGSNATAIAMQIPLSNLNVTGEISVWANTRRFGGQL